MQLGNLITYDNTGKIWSQTGEMDGELLPRVYPVGVPYIELPYGAMKNKIAVSVDVTDPNNHFVVFADAPPNEIDVLKSQVEQLQQKNITTLEALAEVYELVIGGGL